MLLSSPDGRDDKCPMSVRTLTLKRTKTANLEIPVVGDVTNVKRGLR
jgi:hypothetical protein